MAEDEIRLEEGSDFIETDINKKNIFMRNLQIYLADYSNKSTVYGLKYLNEPNRPRIEKLYWLIVLCICFITGTVLLTQTYTRWNESPIVNFVQKPTPIWQTPFPAITLCSETKSKQSVFNFTNYFNRIIGAIENSVTDEEMQQFADTSLLCDNHLFNRGNKTTQNKAIDHIMEIAPQLSELLLGCRFNTVNQSCNSLFSPILTDDGVCFTFNMLNYKDFFTQKTYLHSPHFAKGPDNHGWTLEEGYSRNVGKDTYPRRAPAEGIKGGLFLLLVALTTDLDFICRGPIQGFKVLIHHPAEVPRLESKFIHVPLNQSVVVTVQPEVTKTSSELRNYDPRQRQCFFPGEKPLNFFQIYTQENCRAECVANYTLNKCGCVAYYMPREPSTEICGSGSTKCLFETHKELLSKEAEAGILNYNAGNDVDFSECDCLPSCTTIKYKVDITQTSFHWDKVFEAFGQNVTPFQKLMLSRFTVLFKEREFVTTERGKLYSRTEFLANCGGLLALFIGFSVFSLFEILYFLSVRLICNIRRYGIDCWSGSRYLLNGRYLPE